jgi:hypothetical protein
VKDRNSTLHGVPAVPESFKHTQRIHFASGRTLDLYRSTLLAQTMRQVRARLQRAPKLIKHSGLRHIDTATCSNA